MLSLEDIREYRQWMLHECSQIMRDAAYASDEMREEFKYNENELWNANLLDLDMQLFKEFYDQADVMIMMIEMLYEMETDHDQFVIQREMQYLRERFRLNDEKNSRVTRIGKPRDMWKEPDIRFKRSGERMAGYIKKVNKVIFEDILGE